MAQGKKAADAKQFVVTKECRTLLKDLVRTGKKAVVVKAQAAIIEAQNSGEIQLAVTKHGENRIDGCEKYDLGDGYRLVTVYVGEVGFFMYVGNHEDSQAWLDANKGMKITVGVDNNRIAFIPDPQTVSVDLSNTLNVEAKPELADQPLLKFSNDDTWKSFGLDQNDIDTLRSVTPEKWEDGEFADKTIYGLNDKYGDKVALLFLSLFTSAKNERNHEIQPIIDKFFGKRHLANPQEAVAAIASHENSDLILDFDDNDIIERLGESENWDDWMLFLHPDQKLYSKKDFNGPARLRGISGSGKTCVLVHRARYLAKKYGQPVRVITLTKSTERLISLMLSRLCGVERGNIHVSTVSSFVQDVWGYIDKGSMSSWSQAQEWQMDSAWDIAMPTAFKHPDFSESSFSAWPPSEFSFFVRKEAEYARGRLFDAELVKYLDPREFPRKGRGGKLTEKMRGIVFSAIDSYVKELEKKKIVDFEKISQTVCHIVSQSPSPKIPYRALLIDEVQDLTQIEMNIISHVQMTTGTTVNETENALFLAGDGAQAIFNRGFSFKKAGIDIANRSSLLKRSYRNTFEILRAAYALIEEHQFSDADEDDMGKPSEPHLSAQRGLPPKIVRCSNNRSEAWFIAQSINAFIKSGVTAGQICVLGPNKMRESVTRQLARFNVSVAELKDNVDFASHEVKMSTIESAKGHEFAVVFICGMNKGFLPAERSSGNETSKDAAKLYVAMTRARNSLFLTYSSNTQTDMPSEFLMTIQPHCDEYTWNEAGLLPVRE